MDRQKKDVEIFIATLNYARRFGIGGMRLSSKRGAKMYPF